MKVKTSFFIAWHILFGGVMICPAVGSVEISVNWDSPIGPVKPVNGVGQPPMVGAPSKWRMMHFLKEAGIPYSRLHDVGGWFGGNLYVDIPNLFRNFDADENDPRNYDFIFTDRLLLALNEANVEPFFRLGVTIENFANIRRYRIDPPKDFKKWARICEHVIRHYTEGWANGYRMKINYWEIWNEPDGSPSGNGCCWHGSFGEFMRFYGVVSTHLKTTFPHLKIGGYGSCGFYAAVGAGYVKEANSSPQMQHFVTCFTNFLSHARAERWPLDFFSFHSYSLPDEARRQIAYARNTLDAYGFAQTETCFNEWLPRSNLKLLGTSRQAAMIAAELLDLQNGPCDTAMIYDARCGVGSYSPLFNPLTQEPHKAYYAFMAFNELRKAGTAVKVETGKTPVRAVAAVGNGRRTLMLVNPTDRAIPFAVVTNIASGNKLMSAKSCLITDDTRTWKEVLLPAALPPYSIIIAALTGD